MGYMYILPQLKTIMLLIFNFTSRYSLFGIINSKFSTLFTIVNYTSSLFTLTPCTILPNLKSGFKYHLYIDGFQISFSIPDFSRDSHSTDPIDYLVLNMSEMKFLRTPTTPTPHMITPTQDLIRPKTFNKWFSTGQL